MKMKNYKAIFIVTSVMCLLPLLLSMALYKDLPDQVAIHWSSAGVPDNYVPKEVAAFGLPFLFAAINIFSKMRLYSDEKRADGRSSQAIQLISTWVPPILSLILVPVTLFFAMGVDMPITLIASAFLGGLFILIGNYLPKCRQNYTIGIKLPWTLQDTDNWNKTHHMAGRLWMLGGMAVLIAAFLLPDQTMLGLSVTVLIVIPLVLLPVLYSYRLHQSGRK